MTGRQWWAGVAVAALHFVIQMVLMLAALSRGMARLEHGGSPGMAEHLLDTVASVLQCPLVLLARALPVGGTGHWGWLFLLANSALWGGLAIGLWRLAQRWRHGAVRYGDDGAAVVWRADVRRGGSP